MNWLFRSKPNDLFIFGIQHYSTYYGKSCPIICFDLFCYDSFYNLNHLFFYSFWFVLGYRLYSIDSVTNQITKKHYSPINTKKVDKNISIQSGCHEFFTNVKPFLAIKFENKIFGLVTIIYSKYLKSELVLNPNVRVFGFQTNKVSEIRSFFVWISDDFV